MRIHASGVSPGRADRSNLKQTSRPNGSIRYFSVRESARLQTFPDDFLFHGCWTETMRQLGNAVPVELAEIIARSVGSKIYALKSETS